MKDAEENIVLNLCQTQDYTQNHLVGALADQPELVRRQGEIRKIVPFYPRDHKEKGKGDQIQEVSVKENHLRKFAGGGAFCPRNVFMLLPDNFDELTDEIKEDEKLSPFFREFYENQELISALQSIMRKERDIAEKLEPLLKSELDEALVDKVKQIDETFNSKSSSSSKSD